MIYIANGILYDISFFWQIGLINALLNIIAIWCNYKGYYPAAKTILLASNSLILLLFTNVVTGNGSAVAFFFPVLTCYVVFYDIIKELKTVLTNLTITTVCILGCLMLPEHFFGNVPLPAYMSGNITRLNFMLAFFSFTFYVFLIIKLKLQTERLLIQSRETAEIMADKSDQMVAQLTIQKERAEEASRNKSLFLSNISHELLTPLDLIVGTANNFVVDDSSTGNINQQLALLKSSGEHMQILIKDILDFNKLESGKMQLERKLFNVKLMTEKIAAIFMQQFRQKGIAFYMQVDERLDKEVIADESRIMQVLNNLLSNALTCAHSGSVSLSIQLQSANAHQIKVNFSITDTAGIPPEKSADTLQGFTEADAQRVSASAGSGLALAISEKIIKLCGGKLSVQPVESKGGCFQFTIPLTINKVNEHIPNKAYITPLKPLNGINVLLVEDNTINMLVARRFLSSWDVSIKEAINGQEAVDIFKAFHFDLVILDLEMPVMDGYKAVAQMRKLDAAIPVIAFTASVFDDMKSVLLAAGFDDFLSKPFRPEDLHKIVDTYAIRA